MSSAHRAKGEILMRRDRITFILIIAGAIIVIAIGLGIETITGRSDSNPSATTPIPEGSVVIDFASSNTKENWIDVVIENFNQEEHTTASGKRVFVQVTHVTSGGSQKAILEGAIQPTVWSPGDSSWVETANEVWRDRTGQLLVSDSCTPTVLAPIGFAMWRPMAEALGWPDTPIGWDDLVQLSSDPDGWASLGHPEWGTFKFGHTHPAYSNVGLLIMTAFAHSATGVTGGLTADQVYADDVADAFRRVELNTYHYGIQSRDLLALMVARGPEYLHAVTTSEAETLKTNAELGDRLRFQLVFVFPADGTFWSEQPYCTLDADWVSEEQKEAAGLFLDHLLDPAQQRLAIDNFLRPINATLPLRPPLALDYGTDPRVTTATVPALDSPSSDVANAVIDVFYATKKKATVILALDTSGSMGGDKIANAVTSAVNFIGRLNRDDRVFVMGFGGSSPYLVGEGGTVAEAGETLAATVNGLFADGNTPLYDTVCQAVALVDTLKAEDDTNDEQRLYGIVLLSDGDDTASQLSENQMYNCLPEGESAGGVKVFTIAYGEDANQDLLQRIASRTNGKSFVGDPQDIERIYNAISAEQ
jgi:Ca-activated chloride channel family protein